MDFPIIVAAFSLLILWLSARAGAYHRRKRQGLEDAVRDDLGIILAASLTLLGLIIGFSFSMAVTRYDQRKNYEASEANAIGTEYLRAGLLPATDATRVRELLISYLNQRISFYSARSAQTIEQVNTSTARLEADLWSAVQRPAAVQPTPMTALAVAGMNNVLDSQGYTQAAWWNRIPIAAWVLMGAIAIFCNLLLGYSSRGGGDENGRFLLLPLAVSIAFLLIADLDSPRGGIIRMHPQNLISLFRSLQAP